MPCVAADDDPGTQRVGAAFVDPCRDAGCRLAHDDAIHAGRPGSECPA